MSTKKNEYLDNTINPNDYMNINDFAELLNNIFEELTGIEGAGLVWSGLDVEDQIKKLTIDKDRLATTCSINDLLVENDKKKFELKYGDINIYDLPAISNPQILQLISNALMIKNQEAQQMQGNNNGNPNGDEEEEIEYDEYPNWDENDEVPEDVNKSIVNSMRRIKRIKKSKNGAMNLTIQYK